MVLRFYQQAEEIKKLSYEGDQFVEVCHGLKRGSIAKVIDVKHINYSTHQFHLHIDGHRDFWIKGKFLNYLPDHIGGTVLIVTNNLPQLADMMGKLITSGCVIIFYKIIDPSSTSIPELVIGTVKSIHNNGNIVVKPIIVSSDCIELIESLTLKNNRCLIIDRNLVDRILIEKLAR